MKKILKVLGLLLLIIAIVIWLFTNSLKPTYNGDLDLKNINETVSIYYDDFGIPHIYANNQPDAFTALGYVHAQDRLWQMELLRRIPTGELSELFGKELLKTDKFFIGLGIDKATKKTVKELDTTSQEYLLTKAYLNGINQFLDKGATPIEFYLTGVKKRQFTINDVHNIVGYMAFSFAMAHKTDPLLTNIKNTLGENYLNDLGIDYEENSERIINYSKNDSLLVNTKLITSIHDALSKLPVPQLIGSNSWVIGPEKTQNGKVILANDPHIGFAQPAVWYEAHVSTPTYEMYGYHLGGFPFPLLGHNRELAYGMTMFQNDDLDFYWEENHPTDSTLYKTKNGWQKYTYNTKTIKVKDDKTVSLTVKSTHHGPVLNGIADGISFEKPVAMSWIYTKLKNKMLKASFLMSQSTTNNEFKNALTYMHAPGLNIMYGDAKNNIAWYATAKLYELPKTAQSKFIMDGSSGDNEIERFLEFSENPQALNPPWNYVYSANNQPDSIAGNLYPGYYLPENRAKRIVDLLEPKNDWNKETVSKMITDVKSSVNPSIAKHLLNEIDVDSLSSTEKEAHTILTNWNGDNQLQDIAPTIYHRLIYKCLKNTFEDELGEEQFSQLLKTHLIKRTIAPLFKQEHSVWFDNTNTTEIENKEAIIKQSFTEAITALENQLGSDVSKWTWNRVHTLEHQHPIGKVAALRSYFNVGPFEINGTREVLNNQTFSYDDSGEYKVFAGPSTRRVIDFSDIENSLSILPTGQSGNVFSPHYKDQAELYNTGKFRKMLMNKDVIQSTSENLLVIE